ncbi:pimeloyl-ACP methyl ester carboxylesterase [Dyadobacter sp. BE34]|uniref:Pimeloyl-ACP methyl ester carboxylesterase n=1 Tax=Dyadobacter fermentans TaxID=94254 RepID=A0ABU1QR48_9BACT|nr:MULTISPECIES: alpha/beta hydrolase [Dyadobacter]MDR6803154.1 pimeloyl-ACP methyl ester carboxylesterase [Dyadobacter fermentans]MDR7040895.1 pimeloyl-ACP methyl ester carboxylesterase [Dyadobacter sp. BE242]MDR7195298.1 pimeloyl-ACP methyl ester carboxylesterase [Dyadobacter sp. BE34]MDR7214156.1 pimeloyl-ACP methyl ester carboxylesterase [Dyadobacter sp. BE31]MDR7260705.1 pimeloyl-ACP methyl ester carboxylesterase [Dyadobacter sp. BE32]
MLLAAIFQDSCGSKENASGSNHPQEPSKPYPYYSEDIVFTNSKTGNLLAGTLTVPGKAGVYPATVLITGSGPQNRDEEVSGGHKPFLVLADHLTKQGIAVLRFDDRGVGKSTGDFAKASSMDFADDVESAVEYLKTRKEIDITKIGLIGHSEGGTIASMVAARSKDVDFITLLAAPGIRGDSIILIQIGLIAKALGLSQAEISRAKAISREAYHIVQNSVNDKERNAKLSTLAENAFQDYPKKLMPANITKEQFVSQQVAAVTTPWWIFFLKYDPVSSLAKVTCPVLALNGNKDVQVTPKENLTAIAGALKNVNNLVITKELPGLNHFFQECKECTPQEYAKLKQTFSPAALDEISTWILKTTR